MWWLSCSWGLCIWSLTLQANSSGGRGLSSLQHIRSLHNVRSASFRWRNPSHKIVTDRIMHGSSAWFQSWTQMLAIEFARPSAHSIRFQTYFPVIGLFFDDLARTCEGILCWGVFKQLTAVLVFGNSWRLGEPEHNVGQPHECQPNGTVRFRWGMSYDLVRCCC